MKHLGKKWLEIILCLAMVMGLMAGMTATAYATVDYPLWVGGTQVTDGNCNDLETNHWSYSAETHTLTHEQAPNSGWSESIPTGTEAGIYYVWYQAQGDSNHTDSKAQCVEVTIAGDPASESRKPFEATIGGLNYRLDPLTLTAAVLSPAEEPNAASLGVKKIAIPNMVEYGGVRYTVTEIASEAFRDLLNLKQVKIGKNVKIISWNAFRNTPKLETVILGSGIKEIYQNAFKGSKVKYVHYAGTKGQWKKIKIQKGNDVLKKATRYNESSGPITKLTLNRKPETLKVGATLTLKAKTSPKNPALKLKWTSSKPNVASVKKGVVKAKSRGKTTITCEALDGSGLKVKFNLKVK